MAKKVKGLVKSDIKVKPTEGTKPGTRQFTPKEVQELQELQRTTASFSFVADQVKNNTSLIPNGQAFGAQLEAVARMLQNVRQHWISEKLAECGYKPEHKLSIDVKTGYIVVHEEGVAPENK